MPADRVIRRVESGGQAVEYDVRPLIQVPSWDGKLVLASLFIVGYYALVGLLVLGSDDLPEVKANIVRDAMLTLGPPIGIIIGALFRTTGAEERRDALRSTELTSAIAAAPAIAASAAAAAPNGHAAGAGSTAEDVEEGARTGAREGIREGLDQPGADRVDRGRFPDIEPIVAPLPPQPPTPPATVTRYWFKDGEDGEEQSTMNQAELYANADRIFLRSEQVLATSTEPVDPAAVPAMED